MVDGGQSGEVRTWIPRGVEREGVNKLKVTEQLKFASNQEACTPLPCLTLRRIHRIEA